MKKAVLGLLLLMPFTLWTQSQRTEKQTASPALRKVEVEKPGPAVVAQQNRIQRLIGPETKQTIAQLVPSFERRAMQLPPTTDLYKLAGSEVRNRFPNLRQELADVLVFHLLGEVVRDMNTQSASLSQMSEMDSLRLQMMMDRRSKFITTLSNIMKKISATQDAVVQNLK